MDPSKEVALISESDEELNDVFSPKKQTPSDLRKNFRNVYKNFVENRQKLINELRNIADQSVWVKKGCSISTIAGSSVGIAGGAAAIVGTAAFPPLLVGGLVVAGLATVSNLGTQLTEFLIFRNMVKKVESLSKYDIELMHRMESIYHDALAANLIEEYEQLDGSVKRTNTATNDLSSLRLQLGAGGTKSATVLGLRSVGIEMVEIGGKMMRGIASGAIGIGVIIDGVTIYFTSRDLATGCETKFSENVDILANFKEEELGRIMERVNGTDLLLDVKPPDLLERL